MAGVTLRSEADVRDAEAKLEKHLSRARFDPFSEPTIVGRREISETAWDDEVTLHEVDWEDVYSLTEVVEEISSSQLEEISASDLVVDSDAYADTSIAQPVARLELSRMPIFTGAAYADTVLRPRVPSELLDGLELPPMPWIDHPIAQSTERSRGPSRARVLMVAIVAVLLLFV
jgi:hypothetical protein